MYTAIFLATFCLFGEGFAGNLFSKCKASDIQCIEESVNAALPLILDGIPELGVEKSDPEFDEAIEIRVPMLNVTLFNATLEGYKDCNISKLQLNDDYTSLRCDLYCEPLEANGWYDLSGQIASLPIEGNGDFLFISGYYLLNFNCELEKMQGSDGKTHIKVKNFKFTAHPLTPLSYNFRNLFNGREDLAEVIHKFARENWLAIAELVQDPIWENSLRKVIGNVNKYLERVAFEDIIIPN